MELYPYPVKQRSRGVSVIITAIAGYMLFSFFLLAGFSDQPFTPRRFCIAYIFDDAFVSPRSRTI